MNQRRGETDLSRCAPGHWLYETSGALRPIVFAYLEGGPLEPEQVAALRDYLRQWVAAPAWAGPAVEALRIEVDGLTCRARLDRWLERAFDEGIDPL